MNYKANINFSYITILLFLFPYYFIGNDISYEGVKLYHLSLFAIIFIFAFTEEAVFRYFIPEVFGATWLHLIFYSILFSLAHYFNGGFVFFAFINTFLVSMLLYIIRFSIGFFHCVIFHVLWNSIIVILFGTPLSGIKPYEFILDKFKVLLHPVLSGALDTNNYGVEASFFLTAIILVILAYFYIIYKIIHKE